MKFSHTFYLSAGIHSSLVLGLFLYAAIQGCFKVNKEPEIVTWVSVEPEIEPPTPEPELPQPPKPALPPPPKPKLKKTYEIKRSKKKIPNPAKRKPKPQPLVSPVKPLTSTEITQQMRKNQKPQKKIDFTLYNRALEEKIQEAWNREKKDLPSGFLTVISIRVARKGNIIKREIIKSSGNKTVDAVAMSAAHSVTYIAPFPASYRKPFKDETIYFEVK